jgi:hypothetical protein
VVWTPNGSGSYVETVLPSSGAFPGIAFGISAEGLVVGEDGSDAVVWTPNGSGGYTETILPRLGGSGFGQPHSIRLVGSQIRIAGIDANEAVVWKGH